MKPLNNKKHTKSQNINNNLVIYRLRKHYTQQQVADKAFITKAYYNMIENGAVIPSIKTLKDLAQVLDIPDWKEIAPY